VQEYPAQSRFDTPEERVKRNLQFQFDLMNATNVVVTTMQRKTRLDAGGWECQGLSGGAGGDKRGALMGVLRLPPGSQFQQRVLAELSESPIFAVVIYRASWLRS
jgi:hypothetical protein